MALTRTEQNALEIEAGRKWLAGDINEQTKAEQAHPRRRDQMPLVTKADVLAQADAEYAKMSKTVIEPALPPIPVPVPFNPLLNPPLNAPVVAPVVALMSDKAAPKFGSGQARKPYVTAGYDKRAK
jgi:hypothetical protein